MNTQATDPAAGDLDLVTLAVQNLPDDVIKGLARKALHAMARDAITGRESNAEEAICVVAEKLQRIMPAVNSQEFARQLYEISGIDARKPKRTFSSFSTTLEGITARFDALHRQERSRHEVPLKHTKGY